MSNLEVRDFIISKINEIQNRLKVDNKDPNLHNSLGILLEKLGRVDSAIESYKNAIRCDERFVKAYNNIGVILYKQREYKKAVEIFKLSLKQDDKFISTYINIGAACNRAKMYEDGKNYLLKAIELDSKNSGAYNNLGNIYNKLKEHKKALYTHKKAIELDKLSASNHANIAISYKNLNRYKDAIRAFKKAIELDPNFVNAHFDLATTYLKIGDYKRGFKEYEWRFKKEEMKPILYNLKEIFKKPKFTLKSPKKGKTLLLYSEQGYGDILQFSRFVKELKRRYPKLHIKVEVREALKSLFKKQDFFDDVIARGEELGEFDFHYPLMSLAHLLKIEYKELPMHSSYINIDGDFGLDLDRDRVNIGVVWSASITGESYEGKVFSLRYFEPLMRDKRVRLYSLQVGDSKEIKNYTEDEIVDLEDRLKSFEDTAMAINELDLIITCDTSVAHLAGAMGKECYVILQKDADWRWGEEKSKTIWYPSIKMIRQSKQDDWDSAFKKLYKEIKKRSRR